MVFSISIISWNEDGWNWIIKPKIKSKKKWRYYCCFWPNLWLKLGGGLGRPIGKRGWKGFYFLVLSFLVCFPFTRILRSFNMKKKMGRHPSKKMGHLPSKNWRCLPFEKIEIFFNLKIIEVFLYSKEIEVIFHLKFFWVVSIHKNIEIVFHLKKKRSSSICKTEVVFHILSSLSIQKMV